MLYSECLPRYGSRGHLGSAPAVRTTLFSFGRVRNPDLLNSSLPTSTLHISIATYVTLNLCTHVLVTQNIMSSLWQWSPRDLFMPAAQRTSLHLILCTRPHFYSTCPQKVSYPQEENGKDNQGDHQNTSGFGKDLPSLSSMFRPRNHQHLGVSGWCSRLGEWKTEPTLICCFSLLFCLFIYSGSLCDKFTCLIQNINIWNKTNTLSALIVDLEKDEGWEDTVKL